MCRPAINSTNTPKHRRQLRLIVKHSKLKFRCKAVGHLPKSGPEVIRKGKGKRIAANLWAILGFVSQFNVNRLQAAAEGPIKIIRTEQSSAQPSQSVVLI